MSKKPSRSDLAQHSRPLQQNPMPTIGTRVIHQAHLEQWSGPIPNPETLEKFEKFKPGMTDWILATARLEMAHRHAMEEREHELVAVAIEREHGLRRMALWIGLCIVIVALSVAFGLGWLGREDAAKWIGISTVSALGVTVVTGKVVDRKKAEEEGAPPGRKDGQASARKDHASQPRGSPDEAVTTMLKPKT